MQMQQMTKQAIKTLQEKTNHVLAVEDFDLIEELDAISSDMAKVSKSEQRLLNQPFELCGIKFYPLTVAKSLWYAERCEEWELQGLDQDSFLFWLLSLPNSSDEMDKYSECKKALRAVKKLSRKLHCTQEELTDVYNKCTGVKESSGSGGESGANSEAQDTDYGGVIAVLLREYGGKPDEWLYHTPIEMICTLFKAYSDKVDAENGAARSASAKGGKAVAPKMDKTVARLSRFRKKVSEIESIWEKA